MGLTDSAGDQKQKLTLGINKETIQKAKSLGINISAVTEQILKVMTFDEKQNTVEYLARAYDAFFEAIKPSLKQYGARIKVGSAYEENEQIGLIESSYVLTHDGLFLEVGIMDYWSPTKVSDAINALYEPNRILVLLLEGLIKAAENNRERIKELQTAMRLISALSEDTKSGKNAGK